LKRFEKHEGRVRRGPSTTEVDEFAPDIVADPDVLDEDPHFVKVFQVAPHSADLQGGEGFRTGREILDDTADWEVTMLFGSLPWFGAVQLDLVVIWPVRLPPGFGRDFRFLGGCEKEVAVGPDRDIFPLLFLEPAIGPAFAIERIKEIT